MTSRFAGPAGAGLALLLSALAGSALALEPVSTSFRDWVVGCDNLGGCTALSLPEDGTERPAFLRLRRAAGPAGAMELSLELAGTRLRKPLPVKLSIDASPFPADGRAYTARIVDAEKASVALSEEDATALIAAARRGHVLQASFAGKRYTVSLAGALAAMLWIDERQGRLGTVTALIQKGTRGADTVPAMAPLPFVVAPATANLPAVDTATVKSLTTGLRRRLKAAYPDQCEDLPEGFPNADAVVPLSSGLKLVALTCTSGAYNFGTGYCLLDGSDVAKADPVKFPEPGGDGSNILINAEYDPKTASIAFFAKARGIGDCGTAGSFAWTGERFVLAALSDMPECRGIAPDNWLTLVRSEVRNGR